MMKFRLPSTQAAKKTFEAGLLSEKFYIATLLSLNIIYIALNVKDGSDQSSILIATIPPAFIISIVTTIARGLYINKILLRRLMEDSYIPSVYESEIDLRALNK
jgi:hypothetical protein